MWIIIAIFVKAVEIGDMGSCNFLFDHTFVCTIFADNKNFDNSYTCSTR